MAGIKSKVITFSKSTSAAPASQAVTGVGFTPRAVIFLWSGATANASFRNSMWCGVGFSGKDISNSINSYCAGMSAQHNQTSSNSSRRLANKAISIVEYGNAVNAECDMTSFDSDGFTLNWTTNSGTAHRITAICLGGTDLTAAKAFTWNTPGSTGSQAVTGIGFQPECLLTARTNSGVGSSNSGGSLAFGATDGSSSWLIGHFDNDAQITMATTRGHRTGQVVGSLDSAAAWTTLASLTSFDSDGFTLNWSARTNTNACIGLALNGGSYKAGTTAKSNSISLPVTQAVTGIGFEPASVLFASAFGGTLTGAGTNQMGTGLGAADGTSSHSQSFRDEDGSANSDVASYHDNAKAIVKLSTTANTVLAEASADTDSDGFTWTWSSNDIVSSNISWLAFGPPEYPNASAGNQVIMVM